MTNSVLGKRGYGEQGEKGDKGDQGNPGFTSSLIEYTADASQNNSGFLGQNPTNPIQSGRIRFNNATHADSTALIFSSFDRFGRDIDRILGLIPVGSLIVVQRQTSSQQFVEFRVTSFPVIFNDQFVSVAVEPIDSLGANFATGDLVYALVAYAGEPGPTGPVGPTGPSGTSFTYRGNWSQSTTYFMNDVVSFNVSVPVGGYPNGQYAGTYVCTVTSVLGQYPPMGAWFPMALSGPTGPEGPTGPTGPTGDPGSSTELEYTFSQAAYYGTVPTFNLLNMASGAVTNIGGSVTIGANTGINQLTKTYHVRSNPSTTANGSSSGWVGSTTFVPFFVGQGFKVSYSFGLLDTTTNAGTRTMIGFGNFNTSVTLSTTATVAAVTNQFLGIIQETGESVFSFYSKGPGATGATPVASTVTCTTTNTGWYTVTFHNDVNSSSVVITLKYVAGGAVTTATQTVVCGGANTLSTSQACYPILQRAMAAAGGTTGSAILAISGLRFYTR
jgi:hypothetical protein